MHIQNSLLLIFILLATVRIEKSMAALQKISGGLGIIKSYFQKPLSPIKKVLTDVDRCLFCSGTRRGRGCSCIPGSEGKDETCILQSHQTIYPLLSEKNAELILQVYQDILPGNSVRALVYEDESYYLGLAMAKLRSESTVFFYNKIRSENVSRLIFDRTRLAPYIQKRYPSISAFEPKSLALTDNDFDAAPYDIIVCPYMMYDEKEIKEKFFDLLDELGSLLIIKYYRLHLFKKFGNSFQDAGPLDVRQMDGAIDFVTRTWSSNPDYF